MNKELKEQADRELENVEKYYCPDLYSQPDDDNLYLGKDVKSFIDSLIDKTVQMTEERIVKGIKKLQEANYRVGNKKEKVYWADDIKSLITNKSDINN